jgi:hypothetical protein
MPEILPSRRLAPTRINPKISLFYGKPKVGKTGLISQLEDTINLDFEAGAEMYDSRRVPIRYIDGPTTWAKHPVTGEDILSAVSLNTFIDEIIKEGQAQAKAGKPVTYPYRAIAVDTVDKLEELCEVSATIKYKNSILGKKFEGNSVLDLPQGAGYYHLRNEVLYQIDRLAMICKYLILVAHIKEKMMDKGGISVETQDISLTGKLSSIVCAKVDTIGYVYRDQNKPMMVSFETSQGAVMGSRFTRLAGQRFEFDWRKIFLDEPTLYPLSNSTF